MTRLRWLFFILAIAIGVGVGLYYGWVLSPVEYVDTTPTTLRADFRADYALMVAETFDHDQDIEGAARHLAILGNQTPAQIVATTLQFAQQNKFRPEDIALLQNLSTALQSRQPGITSPTLQPTESQP